MSNYHKLYKKEIRITTICFLVLFITGGIFSSVVIIASDFFFEQVPTPDKTVIVEGIEVPYSDRYGDTMFQVKHYVMGFPLHYMLLVLLSWIGPTIIGAVWSSKIDKIEKEIEEIDTINIDSEHTQQA